MLPRARTGKSFAEKLSAELMDAANNQGAAVRKREETHKMAEANRAFSHYRIVSRTVTVNLIKAGITWRVIFR